MTHKEIDRQKDVQKRRSDAILDRNIRSLAYWGLPCKHAYDGTMPRQRQPLTNLRR